MAGVFVSYRRDDSQGFAGRLADDLSDMLGTEQVFRDVEIPVGSDFTDVLHRAIAACDALVVVIGREWAAFSAQGYGSRLFEPTDWVRAEIEAAFAQRKVVVPVLVAGASMPSVDALPASISRLGSLQAQVMSDRHWDDEIEDLADRLHVLCPQLTDTLEEHDAFAQNPADVLRDLGDRLIDEMSARHQPHAERQSLPPKSSPGPFSRLSRDTLRWIGRGVKKTLTVVVVVGLIYLGIRLFGDAPLLRQLDAVEARLLIGWERLQGYLARL